MAFLITGKLDWEKKTQTSRTLTSITGVLSEHFFLFIPIVSSSYGSTIGLMFDPVFSMINHSCDPNARVIFGLSSDVRAKSLRKIRCSEELTVSYVDNKIPLDLRARSLKKSFLFACKGDLCARE